MFRHLGAEDGGGELLPSQFTRAQRRGEGAVVRYVETLGAYFGGTINRRQAEPFFTVEMLGLAGLGR